MILVEHYLCFLDHFCVFPSSGLWHWLKVTCCQRYSAAGDFQIKLLSQCFGHIPSKRQLSWKQCMFYLQIIYKFTFLWNVILKTGLVSQTCGVSWSLHVCQQGTNQYFANSVVAIQSVSTIPCQIIQVNLTTMQSLSDITLTLLKNY